MRWEPSWGKGQCIVRELTDRYSFVSVSDTASVVPLRHDEYPRFVVGAYPYYVGTFSVSAAFLLFCGIWLALGEGAGVARGNKGKKAE